MRFVWKVLLIGIVTTAPAVAPEPPRSSAPASTPARELCGPVPTWCVGATANWIGDHLPERSPGLVEALVALADHLPEGWEPKDRDSIRGLVFSALAQLADPTALPFLERSKSLRPEVPTADSWDGECHPIKVKCDFQPAIEYAIGRIEFIEAVRHAPNDAERTRVCVEDMFSRSGGWCAGWPVGEAVLFEGGARYVPFLKEEISRRNGEQARLILYVLGEIQRGLGLQEQEAYLVELASSPINEVAYTALSLLRTQGTVASLEGLEAIQRANRGFETQAKKGLLPAQLAMRNRFLGAEQAADNIRWRDILARSGGGPSDDDLRWAIDRFALWPDCRAFVIRRGAVLVKRLVSDLPEMGRAGRSVTIDALGAVLASAPTDELLDLAREISERRDLGISDRHQAVGLLGFYGGPAELEYLTRRAEALRASPNPSDRRELDQVEYALRVLQDRLAKPK